MGDTNTNGGMGTDAVSKKSKTWFKGLKAEFNKIIWTDRETVIKQTISVVSISIVLGAIIAVIDLILQYGVDFLINL
mgnify:CR=1 FL=1